MELKKYNTYMLMIAAFGLILCLSSCAGNSKTGADGQVQGKDYLEDLGNGICLQHPSGLMWQAGKSQNFSNWDDANQHVKSLNLGGFNDWRMPTPDECLRLSKLIKMKKSNCPMETGGNHWVNKDDSFEAGQWESNINCDGPLFRWTKDKKGTVKAVRP